ncbi:F0F1 ATP synthase subunit A [Candidatus Kaiserbacteria bacterium]|nr:F0F1 ATP synthase subunit A [Candidatus Kaiserbacteria bacterium]
MTEVAQEAAHQSGIHVVLAAEQLGTFLGIPITNTLITSWIVVALLITLAFLVGRNLRYVPGRIQLLLEEIIVFIKGFVQDTLENESVARKYLPLFITLFLFIATSNLLEFTPGIGSLGFTRAGEFIPIFRSVNTDLNVTLALAIIVVIIIEVAGVIALGFFKYAGKFLNFTSPINFVVGFIELISEISRLVSFSFRLFGNIFAGEILLAVATFFVPYILPVPLMGFEMFIGFVQAAVFSLLTLFFIKLAITDAHAEGH